MRQEIQIVPEFDPALETSLHKALSDVGTQIAEKASEDSKPETDAGQSTVPEKQPSMKNRRKNAGRCLQVFLPQQLSARA
ncbi:MAG: hypothetical protein ACLSCO_18330 [Gallintestinimicrobium sp.]